MRTSTLSKTSAALWVCMMGGAGIVFDLGCGQTAPVPNSDNPAATDAGPSTDTGSAPPPHSVSEAGPAATPDADQTGSEDEDSGDSGTCAPASTSSFTPSPYVAAIAHQGLCSSTAIAAFVAACGDNGTDATCAAWTSANVAGEAGAGTACGNCMVAPIAKNNGATWTDPEGYVSPNYGACIQISDTAHGAACAAAFNNASGCEAVACDNCDDDAYDQCASTVDEGSCTKYATAENSACMVDFEDGGVSDTCSPSETGGYDPDFTYIANLICGGAETDGGSTGPTPSDAGAD